MGKTGRWLRNFLTGKKEKEKQIKGTHQFPPSDSIENSSLVPHPITTPPTKEKRRWSFRKSTNTRVLNPMESIANTCLQEVQAMMETQNGQMKHAMAMAAATAAAADAAVAAAHAAAAVIKITNGGGGSSRRLMSVEDAAAIRIQSVFRSYLARKALCALRGLVKLQALVRGHLVRKQANATLRCMQALVSVQARACAQRISMNQESSRPMMLKQSIHGKTPQQYLLDNRYRQACNDMEENIKIVEMDLEGFRGGSINRRSYSNHTQTERADQRFSTNNHKNSKQDYHSQVSPATSALTDSPRTCSAHFEEYSSIRLELNSPRSSVSKHGGPFTSTQEYADPMSYEYPFFPNYMANTESFKAKVRSQSAPKQRPDSSEKPPNKQRLSMEGRNIPRLVKMQRSSSHAGSAAHGSRDPWSIKLDRSTVSLKDSECGSTSTVLTSSNYCRSLAGYESRGNLYWVLTVQY